MAFDKEQAYTILHPQFQDLLKAQEPLARHCSFEVGGPADLWLILQTQQELQALIRTCTTHQWPLLLVGEGRNILFADAGVRGIVARIDWQQYEIDERSATLIADAGVRWPQLLAQLHALGWAGLEFGIGIPGTLGAGLISNAGAHHQDLGQALLWIDVLDARACNTGQYDVLVPLVTRRYMREELDLGYRHSRFRVSRSTSIDADGKLTFPSRKLIEPAEIVLRLALHLQRQDPQQIATLAHRYLQERRAQEPALPKTGPVFKDPAGSFAKDLIARAGLAGKTRGNAQITEHNANYIANLGGATAHDILSLILMAHQHVLATFGIDLLLNLELLGEWEVLTA
ncbi:MAG TPA: FAD-binding protein [Ktedonobacteraceae bacterium]|nr:FAD-binding protein [Ktedonobacteraceae bacterium]